MAFSSRSSTPAQQRPLIRKWRPCMKSPCQSSRTWRTYLGRPSATGPSAFCSTHTMSTSRVRRRIWTITTLRRRSLKRQRGATAKWSTMQANLSVTGSWATSRTKWRRATLSMSISKSSWWRLKTIFKSRASQISWSSMGALMESKHLFILKLLGRHLIYWLLLNHWLRELTMPRIALSAKRENTCRWSSIMKTRSSTSSSSPPLSMKTKTLPQPLPTLSRRTTNYPRLPQSTQWVRKSLQGRRPKSLDRKTLPQTQPKSKGERQKPCRRTIRTKRSHTG